MVNLSLIVAMSENRVIGKDNRLPWHLPADLKHFKQITTAGGRSSLIMGRKTYDSIGKPLPGRRNIVITRNRKFAAAGTEIAHSLDEAIRLAGHEAEVFIIGGAQIFAEALNRADRLYLTLVHAIVEGDTYFPPVHWSQWQLVEDERHEPDAANPLPFSFQRFDRLKT